MRKLILTLLVCISFTITYAQDYTLKGTVTDSLENRNPPNCVISILRPSDSVLVQFTRSDKEGKFSLNLKKPGEYLLMITHPYMGDFFENILVKENGVTDLATLYLTPKSKLLEEVIVKTGSPIRIKGDTTVYTADSFKTRAGANVEELLRKLPGISVDREGNITALGERVTKVLVDGEEFFGTDPGIATKNLRADAVGEIQVFDKRSDQAEFTGIDDGVRDRTINIKMKRNAGHFGKVELAGGLKDKFDNAAMFNSFVNKRKIAAYGLMGNTGRTQLGWQDNQNYGGSTGMESGIMEGGGMFIVSGGGGEDNYSGGRNGIPTNWNGGLHYSNKFGKDDKQSINTGYRYSKVNAPGITRTYSQNFLPDTSWNNNSISDNYSSNIRNALNATLDINIDSANSLKWTMQANKRNSLFRSDYFTEAFSLKNDSINNNVRNNHTDTENSTINTTLLWRHKFKKTARTLSVNTSFNWNESNSDGILYSLAKYYDNGVFNHADTLNQQNLQNNSTTGINTRISYTEPLAKDLYMEATYALEYNTNNNDIITNHKGADGKFDQFVDTLSLSYRFNRIVHTPGISFRFNKKKYNLTLGASAGFNTFIQDNKTASTSTTYRFTNFFPRLGFQYKIKPNENLRFDYNGTTTAPSLQQLQPLRINNDPLNEFVGNPNLEQSFQHRISTNYNFYNVLDERGLWSYINANFTDNAFVQSSNVGLGGKRTYQTVNASGVYNINVGGNYHFAVTKHKIRLGIGPNFNLNKRIDFVNNIQNTTHTTGYGANLNISKEVSEKFELYLSPTFSWNKSNGSISTGANAEFWQLSGWVSGRVYLPYKFDISTDMETEIRQKDPRFPANNNFTRWDVFITKRLMKNNNLEVKFGLYDILNQNRGFDRSFNSYNFTETFYNTLQRFWLLKLTWNFSKNGQPASGW